MRIYLSLSDADIFSNISELEKVGASQVVSEEKETSGVIAESARNSCGNQVMKVGKQD